MDGQLKETTSMEYYNDVRSAIKSYLEKYKEDTYSDIPLDEHPALVCERDGRYFVLEEGSALSVGPVSVITEDTIRRCGNAVAAVHIHGCRSCSSMPSIEDAEMFSIADYVCVASCGKVTCYRRFPLNLYSDVKVRGFSETVPVLLAVNGQVVIGSADVYDIEECSGFEDYVAFEVE